MSTYFNDPWFWINESSWLWHASIRTYGPDSRNNTPSDYYESMSEDCKIVFLGSTGKGKIVKSVLWWGDDSAEYIRTKWGEMFEKNEKNKKEFFDIFPHTKNIKLMHYFVGK